MPSRGTDRATEERRLRPTEGTDDDPTHVWLVAMFGVCGETFLVGIPTYLWILSTADIVTMFVGSAATAGFCVAGATTRARNLETRRAWPSLTPLTVALLFVYLNVVLPLSVLVGLSVPGPRLAFFTWTTEAVLIPAAVSAVIAGAAALAFPLVALRVTDWDVGGW